MPYRSKGRDLTGWDCYGLCRFVMAERLGLLVPSYADEYISETDVAPALANRAGGPWRPVAAGDEHEGDVVVLLIGGVPSHCGYVIELGTMLHARKGCGTVVESYLSTVWRKRLEGIYRCKS